MSVIMCFTSAGTYGRWWMSFAGFLALTEQRRNRRPTVWSMYSAATAWRLAHGSLDLACVRIPVRSTARTAMVEQKIPSMRTSGSKVNRGHSGRPGRSCWVMLDTCGRYGCCRLLLPQTRLAYFELPLIE
jgi:hypothetical protein